MDAKAVSQRLGVASAIKMCRSVMIKGLEALVIESYTTARQYGVEDHVLPTLAETFPSIDWNSRAPTSSAAWCSTASAGPRKCARRPTRCARPGSSRSWPRPSRTSSSGWPTRRAAGVFEGLPKDARWQDYADRLIAESTKK